VLYLLTGLIAGLQVFTSLMQAVWGAPTHPVQYIALVGALSLVVASVVALFRGRAGGLVAFGASFFCWAFYLPAMWATLARSGFTLAALPFVLVPLALLSGTTVHGWFRIWRRQLPHWAFPDAATTRARRLTLIGATAVVVALAVVRAVAVGRTRTVTEETMWRYGETVNGRGEREIELRFVRFPKCFWTAYSTELEAYLAGLRNGRVPVTMVVTSDFGRTRGTSPRSIGTFAGNPGWAGAGREGDGACPW
jgi:hypothetical protein